MRLEGLLKFWVYDPSRYPKKRSLRSSDNTRFSTDCSASFSLSATCSTFRATGPAGSSAHASQVKELETRRHVTRSEEQESAAKILERPYDTVVSYPIMTKKGKKLGTAGGVRQAGKGLTPKHQQQIISSVW